MGTNKIESLQEKADYIDKYGFDAAVEYFGIKYTTLDRQMRDYRKKLTSSESLNKDGNKDTESVISNALIKKLSEQFTNDEIKSILKGSLNKSKKFKEKISFNGKDVLFCHMTDTHIGSVYFSDHYLENALEECHKQGVDFICHTGDLTEGMSNRPGQVYELSEIGYHRQKEKAIDLFKNNNIPVKIISGNHDNWYIKSNGAEIVRDVADKFDNWTFLGHHNGTVEIDGVKILLRHGEDGASYAISYRPQKIIENISGGDKPHVLLNGHDHKSGYFYIRNIHSVSGGALSWQSSWMRNKKLANHCGFWIIKMTIGEGEVKRFSPTWYPFYRRY